MFDNIGNKLKKLAKVSTVTGIICYAIIGLFVIADQPLIGFIIFALGSLLSWFGSFTIYGLGQLIENTDELVKQGRMAPQAPVAPVPQPASVHAPAPAQSYVADPLTNTPAQAAPVNSTPAPAPQPAQEQPLAGIPAENGKVACPVCGTVQNANRRVCLHCAQPLIPTQP